MRLPSGVLSSILQALVRSVASLGQARVWALICLPALLAFVLWLCLAVWGLTPLAHWLNGFPPMTWLTAWGVPGMANVLAYFGAWMIVFSASYLSASLLAALIVMPALLGLVARRQYPDVHAMGADSYWGATMNSLGAGAGFVLGWLLTIPLWLIPGMSLLLPVLLMAWYNRRTFAYDALSMHATADEWRLLRQQHGRSWFVLGLVMAILAHLPLVGLLVPALAALAYIHHALEGLRQLRDGAIVTAQARRIEE